MGYVLYEPAVQICVLHKNKVRVPVVLTLLVGGEAFYRLDLVLVLERFGASFLLYQIQNTDFLPFFIPNKIR